jgi:hypothetical protein
LTQKLQHWVAGESGLQPVYAEVPLAGNCGTNRASLSALNVSRVLVPKSTSELVVERFYAALDEEVETSLTAEQKRGIEQALVAPIWHRAIESIFAIAFRSCIAAISWCFFLVGICAKSRARAPCSGASSRPC